MPPAGAPRPDPATYEPVATFLETELDRAAAARPHPGTLPLLHRLSRTDTRTRSAICSRSRRCPAKSSIAAAAARQRQQRVRQHRGSAVRLAERHGALSRRGQEDQPPRGRRSGDAADGQHPPAGSGAWQEARVDELPIGTRGGLAVRSYFPMDGDYTVKLDVAPRVRPRARDPDRNHRGRRTDAAGERRRSRRRAREPPDGRAAAGAGRGAPPAPGVPLPVKAGPRLVGVTFVERNQARTKTRCGRGCAAGARSRRSPT